MATPYEAVPTERSGARFSANLLFVLCLMISIGGCVPTRLPPDAPHLARREPLRALPAGDDLALVREDLAATVVSRFGADALRLAEAAPTYLVVKRFAGMPPPPPPGAPSNWTPPTPTALLMKRSDGWMVATATGWRPARDEPAGALDALLRDDRFWQEPATVPPCPDYGASLLRLKVPGRPETIRKSACTSVAEQLVMAGLRA